MNRRWQRLLVTAAAVLGSTALASSEPAPAGPSAEQGAKLLIDGNARFMTGNAETPRQDQGRRCETYSKGQHPFAAVLACADSRVPVEELFDQGVGDVFVVRVAGNVAGAAEIGSLEYGVEHLHIPLVVVMGHNKCGAVTAALNPPADASPALNSILRAIVPAAERAKDQNAKLKGDALVSAAVKANVGQQIDAMIEKSEILRKAMGAGELKIVGAVYDLHSGQVTWLNTNAPAKKAEPAAKPEPAKPAPAKAAEHGHESAGHGH